jgi:hypothetical protein
VPYGLAYLGTRLLAVPGRTFPFRHSLGAIRREVLIPRLRPRALTHHAASVLLVVRRNPSGPVFRALKHIGFQQASPFGGARGGRGPLLGVGDVRDAALGRGEEETEARENIVGALPPYASMAVIHNNINRAAGPRERVRARASKLGTLALLGCNQKVKSRASQRPGYGADSSGDRSRMCPRLHATLCGRGGAAAAQRSALGLTMRH